jgi:hypothetical protein
MMARDSEYKHVMGRAKKAWDVLAAAIISVRGMGFIGFYY